MRSCWRVLLVAHVVAADAALHPAAQVQRWKQRLRGWLWNPEITPREANDIYSALLRSGHMETLAEYSDVVAALGLAVVGKVRLMFGTAWVLRASRT